MLDTVAKDNLRRLMDRQRQTTGLQVVAPVMSGGKVRIEVDGLMWDCPVLGSFTGWGVFILRQPIGTGPVRAELLREAEVWEREAYARRFPGPRLTLFTRVAEGVWWGSGANLKPIAPVPSCEAEAFDVVRTAIGAAGSWFVGPDLRQDSRKAARLREFLVAGQTLDDRLPGLHLWERDLYRLALSLSVRKPDVVTRLRDALSLAGARLLSFEPRGGNLEVRWEKDALQRVTQVRESDLTVVSAGICLSGRDPDFDLASIVSVMREQGRRGRTDHA